MDSKSVASLSCECQELKPQAETNGSFLVLHPPSGVNTVNTVGSHLNYQIARHCADLLNNLIVVGPER